MQHCYDRNRHATLALDHPPVVHQVHNDRVSEPLSSTFEIAIGTVDNGEGAGLSPTESDADPIFSFSRRQVQPSLRLQQCKHVHRQQCFVPCCGTPHTTLSSADGVL